MKSLSRSLAFAGAAFLAAVFALVITKAPLGSPVFLACFATVPVRTRRCSPASGGNTTRLTGFSSPPSLLPSRFACRLRSRRPGPTATWFGTCGTAASSAGLQPLSGIAVRSRQCRRPTRRRHGRCRACAHGHPIRRRAQLFFRFVVGLRDSSRAMKLALVACDLLTIIVLWRWLVTTGRTSGWRSRTRGTRSWCSRSRIAATSMRSARCGSRHRRTGWPGAERRSRRSRSSSR